MEIFPYFSPFSKMSAILGAKGWGHRELMLMIQQDTEQMHMQCFPMLVSEHFTLTINHHHSSSTKTIHLILQETEKHHILSECCQLIKQAFLINVPALVYTHTSILMAALRKSYTIQRLVENKINFLWTLKSKLSGPHTRKKNLKLQTAWRANRGRTKTCREKHSFSNN